MVTKNLLVVIGLITLASMVGACGKKKVQGKNGQPGAAATLTATNNTPTAFQGVWVTNCLPSQEVITATFQGNLITYKRDTFSNVNCTGAPASSTTGQAHFTVQMPEADAGYSHRLAYADATSTTWPTSELANIVDSQLSFESETDDDGVAIPFIKR